MRYGPGWFLRMLLAVIVIGLLMSVAFGAGVAADGGSFGHYPADGHYPGARSIGCLFGLALLALVVVGVIACAFRGPRHFGPGYYGGPGWHGRHRRYWPQDDWREDAESMMEDWHRRAHGESVPGASPSAGSTPPAPESPKSPRGKVR